MEGEFCDGRTDAVCDPSQRRRRDGCAVKVWLRGVDLNHRPLGYEPNELPDCSTPHEDDNNGAGGRQTAA
jgi:hypothetical protein